jgi:hypothetical protein
VEFQITITYNAVIPVGKCALLLPDVPRQGDVLEIEVAELFGIKVRTARRR